MGGDSMRGAVPETLEDYGSVWSEDKMKVNGRPCRRRGTMISGSSSCVWYCSFFWRRWAGRDETRPREILGLEENVRSRTTAVLFSILAYIHSLG